MALFSGFEFQKSMSLHRQATHTLIVSTERHIQSTPWWTMKAKPECSDSKLLSFKDETMCLMPDLLLMKYNITGGKICYFGFFQLFDPDI